MNARVAQRVFAQALIIIGRLGGKGVADEFGVQVARMIRRLQRKAEIVHGEYIFEKVGIVQVANAARLARESSSAWANAFVRV